MSPDTGSQLVPVFLRPAVPLPGRGPHWPSPPDSRRWQFPAVLIYRVVTQAPATSSLQAAPSLNRLTHSSSSRRTEG